METTARNLKETADLAREFAHSLAPQRANATIVALVGDLGSGKTSFVQGAAKALGVTATVISPTFVIERAYKLVNQKFDRLVHLDCYRIENSDEITRLGWDEKIANPRNLIFVEWAERIEELLPENTVRIHFEVVDETTRKVKVLSSKQYGKKSSKP